MATTSMTPLAGSMPPMGAAATQINPQQFADQTKGLSDERSVDAVTSDQAKPKLMLNEDDKKAMLWIIDRYTERFNIPRRPKIRQVLRAREYTKGKQYVSFDPYNFSWFDPLEAIFEGAAGQEDLSIYRYVNNIYQMLEMSFVGALCPQVPKVRWLPWDPKNELDVLTAKHGSDVQAYIERQNKIKRLQRLELMYLWTDGCYFKYTRFVVDEVRAGTRSVPIVEQQERNVIEAGYLCRGCGEVVPEADTQVLGMVCPKCGSPLRPADYQQAVPDTVPVVTGSKDVPEGMVKWSVYGALHITAAPWAQEISESPMTRLDEEVDVAAIRTSYPEVWTEATATAGNAGDDAARIARQYVYSAIGGRNNLTSEVMPTLSRTWLQPWAFALHDNRLIVKKLQELFPKGVKVVHLGNKFLEAFPERVTDHWTHCAAFIGYGLYPMGVGDCALDVQDQFNDCKNIIMEFMDRSASPGGYVNESAIDSRAINGKPNLPGMFTTVKVKGEYRAMPMEHLFFYPKVQLNEHIFGVVNDHVQFAQLVTGVLPQTYGGGQQHIDTFGGQQQALNTAMTRLQQFLDEQREEHAEASSLALRIAAENHSDVITDVQAVGPNAYAGKSIPIDEIKGKARAYPESDQGFPATAAEIRDRLEKLFTAAKTNAWLLELFDDPNNARLAADYLGFPGMTVPGEATRSKVAQVIQILMEQQPTSRTINQPVNGQLVPVKISIPSMHPDPDFDDFEVAKKVIRDWAEENWQQLDTPGGENVRAFYREVEEMEMMKAGEEAMRAAATGAVGDAAGGPAGAAPGAQPGGMQ